jgi:O-succinylbenzoic acid--CoA ligase
MSVTASLKATDGIFSSSQRTPHKVAIRCGDRSVSYSELTNKVRQIQHYCVHKLKLKPGDRVSLLGNNSIEYLEILIALIDIGVGVVTINPKSSQEEIDRLRNDLVTSVNFILRAPHILFTEAGAYESTVDLSEELLTDEVTFDWNLPSTIIFSSGTTGRSKPIFISHKTRVMTSLSMPLSWRWQQNDIYLSLPSLSTGGGSGCALAALYIGMEVVIPEQYTTEYLVDIINKRKVTTMVTVPALTYKLVNQRYNHAINSVISTADVFPYQLKVDAYNLWPMALYETYATTEHGPITLLTPDDLCNKPNSVGRPCIGSMVKIVDEQGAGVPTNTPGNIVATTLTQTGEGWLPTNDIGYLDSDNYLYILGRANNMIVTRGFNIHPLEIEEAINQYPGVVESCVVGKQNARWGEIPVAFIVGDVDTSSLKAYLRNRLAKYKVPRTFIVVESIPKNILGKIERNKLRELL